MHPSTTTTTSTTNEGGNATMTGNNIDSRRKAFMTEKEKKEELIMKQRAELAIKKGTAELDPAIEKAIALEVLEALEAELTKLLLVDGEDASQSIQLDNRIRTNLPISRKSIQDNILVNHTQFGAGSIDLFELGNSTSSSNNHPNHQDTTTTGSNTIANTIANTTAAKNTMMKQVGDINSVNLEDLFDLENVENSLAITGSSYLNGGLEGSTSNNNNNNHSEENGSNNGNNEFAAELLYIMKTSISLS